MKSNDIQEKDYDLLAKGLYKVEFFSSFKRSDFDKIVQSFEVVDYDAGETIFKQGDPGEAFFIVKTGTVDVVKKKLGFLTSNVANLGELECFGEMALVDKEGIRTATVSAGSSGATVFKLACHDFSQLFANNPSFEHALKSIATTRNSGKKK